LAVHLILHPTNPQARYIAQAAAVLQQGGVLLLPSDSGYSLVCGLEQKAAMEKIQQARQLTKTHLFTLYCPDIASVSRYAQIDNASFQFIKAHSPAPVTFVLPATRELPRRLMQEKRRTIGVRISSHPVMQALLMEYSEPVMGVSALNDEETVIFNPAQLARQLEQAINLVLDQGELPLEPSTVVDLSETPAKIVRQGTYQVHID
jgi:tRNA threonylcarbamoyl adenosine modification protein (Sua5/YciO/YrdC/YwlC family)